MLVLCAICGNGGKLDLLLSGEIITVNWLLILSSESYTGFYLWQANVRRLTALPSANVNHLLRWTCCCSDCKDFETFWIQVSYLEFSLAKNKAWHKCWLHVLFGGLGGKLDLLLSGEITTVNWLLTLSSVSHIGFYLCQANVR